MESHLGSRIAGIGAGLPGSPVWRLALLALGMLAAGLAVYGLARAPGSAMAWPAAWHIGAGSGVSRAAAASVLLGSLPSFAHAFAFSLLSVLLLPQGRFWAAAGCAAWAGIDTAFEVLQHPAAAAPAARWLQEISAESSLHWGADKVARYLLAGRFDAWDVLAGLLGALAAYGLAQATLPAARRHGGPQRGGRLP